MSIIGDLDEKAQTEILNKYYSGASSQAIVDEIASKYDKFITQNAFKKWIHDQKKKSLKIIKGQENFQTKLVEQAFNTINQLKELNSEMWKLFYEIKENPELKEKLISCPSCNRKIKVNVKQYDNLIKVSEHLLKQISHQDTLLGRLQNKQLTITYNVVDLSKKLTIALPKILERLENNGILTIKNKQKLRKFYEQD